MDQTVANNFDVGTSLIEVEQCTELVDSQPSNINLPAKRNFESVITELNSKDIIESETFSSLVNYLNTQSQNRNAFYNSVTYKASHNIPWGLDFIVPKSLILNPSYGEHFIISIMEFQKQEFEQVLITVYVTEDFYATNKTNIRQIARTDLKERLNGYRHTNIAFVFLNCTKDLIQSLADSYLDLGNKNFSDDKEATAFKDIVSDVLREYPSTSDIHFEVANTKGATAVRIRHDGDLMVFKDFAFEELKTTIRVAYDIIGGDRSSGSTIQGNNLNFSKPQTGKFKYNYKNRHIEMRVEFVPRTTEDGGDLICRITSDGRDVEIRSLDTNGYHPIQSKIIKKHALKKQGNILFSGVTGSGKSQSGYSTIDYMQSHYQGTRKILTAENPVELNLSGTTQVNLEDNTSASTNKENSLSEQFNKVAQSFWRADPDIIFSGEIRSKESAEFAIEAARTGHLCLSTIHTAGTTDIPSRLDGFGIPRNVYQSSSSLTCLIAQSLVRTVCPSCSMGYQDLPKDSVRVYQLVEKLAELELLEYLGNIRFNRKGGCPDCNHAPDGRKGRTLVAEVLEADTAVRECWAADNDEQAKKQWLLNGGFTKLEHGIYKLCKGELDIDVVESEVDCITQSRTIRMELGVPLYHPEI